MNNPNLQFKIFLLLFNLLILFSPQYYSQNEINKPSKTLSGTSDSLIVSDSTSFLNKSKIKFWTIKIFEPINYQASYSLVKSNFDFMDYKYSGNLISYLPFGSLNDFGYLGSSSFINLFSLSSNNIALTFDGITFNNRWNSFSDFNTIQTEDVNSIELLPPTQSFLWNNINLPITIKAESIDSIGSKPLTRIRYYQFQDNEASIDASFSAKLFSKLGVIFRLTNSTTDGNFTNSSYGVWKASLKTIYNISDSLNIKGTFSHLKSDVNLFGGIDVESIFNLYQDPKSVLYNSSLALVNFTDQNETTLKNSIKINLYGRMLNNIFSDLNIYYETMRQDFNRNKDNPESDSLFISNSNDYETLNIKSDNTFRKNNFSSIFQFQFEHVKYKIDNIQFNNELSNYSAFILTKYKMFQGLLTPQAYGKYLNYNSINYYGYGFDLLFNISQHLKFTAGFSSFEKPFSILEDFYLSTKFKGKKENFSNLFVSAEYASKNIKSSISFFNIKSNNSPVPIFSEKEIELNSSKVIFKNTDSYKNSGINLNSDISIGVISVFLNLNYYLKTNENFSTLSYKYSFLAGLYYIDTLFNSNLRLKTGLNLYYNSDIKNSVIDFQNKRSSNLYFDGGALSKFSFINFNNSNLKLDFILIGRIQDRANFYFVFENILGQSYYLIPYYPMYERGIRIGISWDFIN